MNAYSWQELQIEFETLQHAGWQDAAWGPWLRGLGILLERHFRQCLQVQAVDSEELAVRTIERITSARDQFEPRGEGKFPRVVAADCTECLQELDPIKGET